MSEQEDTMENSLSRCGCYFMQEGTLNYRQTDVWFVILCGYFVCSDF